jgi:hypothetical protein
MSYVERRRFLWILFLAALTLLAIAANATTLARVRFEELAQQATAVARLRCLSTQSFWHNGEIWTDTQFEVVEQAKGALQATIVVRTLGGTLGHLHSNVEEVPVFHPGEETYLFLWGSEGQPLRVLGWSQGTFRITRNTRTGAETITQSLSVWTSVSGSLLLPGTLTPIARTATQNACGADGLNSICFDQMDMAFTPGVLAFTRVITADVTGIQIGSSAVATELGQILDADIYLSPGDPNTTFATPQELPAAPKAYDLESVLTHELGHLLGFSHSAVWSAMMFPFAPAPGTIGGTRPTTTRPDAPLGDDDRTGLRVLYPDPTDTLHQGTISGRIIPANPLALPAFPPE